MDHRDGLMRLARDHAIRDELEPPLGVYCHQFRNRLNSIKLGLYLARRQATQGLEASWEAVERDYRAIEDRLDQIQQVCRSIEVTRVAIDLDLLFEDRARTWADAMDRGGATLILTPPPGGCPTIADVGRLGSGLDDLVRWRATARSGPREVRVTWGRGDGQTFVRWREDSGGSTPADGEATEPGRTWTLPILARWVADHDGTLAQAEDPAWELTLEWPP